MDATNPIAVTPQAIERNKYAVLLCGYSYLIGVKDPKLLALWQDLN